MKISKKTTLIALACVLVVSAAAFFALNGGSPAEPDVPAVNNTSGPDANVSGITSENPGKTADPSPISPSSKPEATPDVIDPGKTDTDVTVPLTDPVEKPTEADPDLHENGDENEPPEPTTPPPASTPKPDPPKSSEPQSGDTNDKGQVWVPGFGWVTPGGENQVIPGDSDGDINKPVGDM